MVREKRLERSKRRRGSLRKRRVDREKKGRK